jgi:hypothetical protein
VVVVSKELDFFLQSFELVVLQNGYVDSTRSDVDVVCLLSKIGDDVPGSIWRKERPKCTPTLTLFCWRQHGNLMHLLVAYRRTMDQLL